jgi:glycosyltransferase involved in cell wall biosynthesis
MRPDTRPTAGRVLFVTHNVPRFAGDAAGSFVLRLAVALQHAGVAVQVLAPGSPLLHGPDIIEGVAIERVPYAQPARMTLAYSGTMAEDVKTSWGARFALLGLLYHMRRAIRHHVRAAVRDGTPYDVVHAHWWFPSGLSAWSAGAGASLGVPLMVTMHGSDVRLAQGTKASHGLMRRVLQRAQIRTAVSRWLARTAMQVVPDTHIEVGPMPVDSALFAPPDDDASRAGMLFVGRLNAQKGLADVLQAMARMTHSIAVLHVVGAGPDETELRNQARTLGIDSRITWHGALRQGEIVSLYRTASVVVVPSREEGLGLVAVEAQLCGTAVVAYDSGGLPDVVNVVTGGTLVPPGDIDELARALDDALADDTVVSAPRNAQRHNARTAMLATFSPEAVAARYLAWYSDAMEHA